MAQPPAYSPSTDFSDQERDNAGGRSTVSTSALDAELLAIAATLAAVRSNMAVLQRDDTGLRDAVVNLWNLTPDCRTAIGVDIEPRGLWITATAYAAGDLVDVGGVAYLCPVAHTSGVFAADYAAGKWQAFGAQPPSAAALPFAPPSSMASTDVQAAIEELNTRTRNQTLPLLAHSFGAL